MTAVRNALRYLGSGLFLLFMVMTCIPFYIGAVLVWAVTRPFDRQLKGLHLYSSFWASFYLWTNPLWSVTVEGREHVRSDQPYVIVSNHQSALDILVAFRLFIPFKWVSKIEIFRVPLIGWNMRMNDYVALRRGDHESVEQMMEACRNHLRNGNSVFIFPEGTRSRTGEMRPFKHGAFTLAKEMKVPILPIAISGTSNALPKKSMMLQGAHNMHIQVLPEIPPEQFADTEVIELASEVRDVIAPHVPEHQAAMQSSEMPKRDSQREEYVSDQSGTDT